MIRIYTIFLSTALLIFSGCSRSGAFDVFKVDEAHERAISNLRTATIVQSFETKVILSTIYLNDTLPQQYGNDQNESFFVALYLQDDIRLFYKANLSTPDANLTLNGAGQIAFRELKEDDPLRTLMPIKNDWNRYYLITYPHQKSRLLKLTFEIDPYGTAELMYRKGEE